MQGVSTKKKFLDRKNESRAGNLCDGIVSIKQLSIQSHINIEGVIKTASDVRNVYLKNAIFATIVSVLLILS